MQLKAVGLLALSSLLNIAIGASSFLFGGFATNPEMQDVTMRIGYYVLNLISMVAFVSIFLPWIFAHREHNKLAIFFAILPTLLTCLAILSFLLLDSWLKRTFTSEV